MKTKAKRMLWSESDMLSAMAAVLESKMKCGSAAKKFNVPRKSLENRIKGRVQHGTKSGPATSLSPQEETSLVEYIKYMCSRGFPITKKICKVYAWAIIKRSGRKTSTNPDKGPSDKWWKGFKQRHNNLSLRKADRLDRGRARMANINVINQYFDLLGSTLTKLDIKDKPERICNCDESGISLDPRKEKVIAPLGQKHVYSQQAGTRDHVTFHFSIWYKPTTNANF